VDVIMTATPHPLASVSPSAPRAPRRHSPVLVLGTTAIVVVGALALSALFFTAGLVLVPVLVAAAVLAMVATRRSRAREAQREEDARSASAR
jgi:hypothetical protein